MSNIYIIKAGDTLWGISKKYHTTVKKISYINNISSKDVHNLQIGQKIYIEEFDGAGKQYDTKLKITLMDIAFNPILKAIIKLEFDGKQVQRDTENSRFENILIEDHTKGIKVYLKNIHGSFDLIANHKQLPLGNKTLKLTSRKIKVEGKHYSKEGVSQVTIKSILGELKKKGQHVVDGVGSILNSKDSNTGKKSASNLVIPPEQKEQKRTDSGSNTHIVVSQFTEDNLLLKPVNNKYRAFIVSAAKRHGFVPQSLTAFMEAEAAKLKTGEWNEKSYNKKSKAGGLTQFLEGTWLEMCQNKKSLVGQYVEKNPNLSRQKKLDLRFNAEMSIDAAAAYAVYNFKASKLPYQNLSEPSSMAKFAYLLHHEGAGGARQFVNNSFSQERAKHLLFQQIDSASATKELKKYNGDAKAAYGSWLRNYIDGHINIYQYVVDKSKTSRINVSMDETIKLLKGQAVATQAPKPQSDSMQQKIAEPPKSSTQRATTSPPSQKIEQTNVGGGDGWHNPLASCRLRTAKLPNARAATFGLVRVNNTKNHQGVDLQADKGTDTYAVCSGVVVYAAASGGAYGKIVVIKVDIDDLPEKQKKYAQKKLTKSKYVYFFYAHLSVISVHKNDLVDPGDIIGKTGDTGNADGMNTIAKGGHLHFEARSEPLLGIGLGGRIDPIPFINASLPY